MRVLLTFLLLIAAFSCEKVEIDESDLENGRIMVIGHGGAGFQTAVNPLPTNSMISIKKAVDVYNADGIEVDVQLSKDNKVFLYHSDILDDKTSCLGAVSEYNSSELKGCNYRKDFAVNALLDESLIDLEQVLNKYAGYQDKPYIFIDSKFYPENYVELSEEEYYEILAEQISSLTKKYNYSEKVIVEGKSVFYLKELRSRNSHLKLFLNGGFKERFHVILENNFDGLTMKTEYISKEQVAKAHDFGKKIALYNVSNQKSTKNAVEKSPDFIQTDNIRLLTRILD